MLANAPPDFRFTTVSTPMESMARDVFSLSFTVVSLARSITARDCAPVLRDVPGAQPVADCRLTPIGAAADGDITLGVQELAVQRRKGGGNAA